MLAEFIQADATRLPFADDTFDLVFGSPPYMDARTYGIGAQRDCEAWVEWMLTVVAELTRVCKGLVLINCAGVTRDKCYWPGCEGLMWEWWKRGHGALWRPAYWHRVGIPGSGGKQWLRADIEYVIPFKKNTDWLAWADNTANGHEPKFAPGGAMSHRVGDDRKKRRAPNGSRNGDVVHSEGYTPPTLANPGCLIRGIKVGGGLLGHPLAHENEAPFPEKLADWFIRSWCPPGGMVLDPFSGSGTTVASAVKLGRVGVGCDLRFSQCQLGRKRTSEVQTELYA